MIRGTITIRFVSVFYFSFVSHVRASEIKLKQICFVSVLFQFYVTFTCASGLSRNIYTTSSYKCVLEVGDSVKDKSDSIRFLVPCQSWILSVSTL